MAERAVRRGDVDAAEQAVEQGQKPPDTYGCTWSAPGLAHLRGVPSSARIFEQCRRTLADDADEIAGIVASPFGLAFRELMAPAQHHGGRGSLRTL